MLYNILRGKKSNIVRVAARSIWAGMPQMGDFPERDLCDILVSFFNTVHFKLLKTDRVVSGPMSHTRKNFLTDS